MIGSLVANVTTIVQRVPDATADIDEAFISVVEQACRGGDDGAQAENATLSPDAAQVLASLAGLTGGAREGVKGCRNVFDAVATIFSDKGFRERLRADPRLIRTTSPGLQEVIRSASNIRSRPPGIAVPVAVKPLLSPEPFAPGLRKVWNLPFQFKTARGVLQTTVGDFVSRAADEELDAFWNAQADGLLASNHRSSLILIWRAIEDGLLKVSSKARIALAILSTRYYLANNAAEMAYRLATSITSDPVLLATLAKGELARLEDLQHRAALRSGRHQTALEGYARSFFRRPSSAAALMNYFGVLFAVDVPHAMGLARSVLHNNTKVSHSDLIFLFDFLLNQGQHDEAMALVLRLLAEKPDYADGHLGLALLARSRGDLPTWRLGIGRYAELAGMPLAPQPAPEFGGPFSFHGAGAEPTSDHPMISVVMTSFNSAATIGRAVESVLAQDLAHLELFVVDDVSTDDTREILRALSQRDPRVKPVFNGRNIGTYASKNSALERCSGDFVTFHDSDDWMHPGRLRRHLDAAAEGIVCSTSNWLRMSETGAVIVRRGGPYTHLNPASTFIRRSALEDIGPFDYVRTGADSEILFRMRNRFGWQAVRSLPQTLGLGLHHEASLTQAGATAFDEYRYSPVRLAYTESWLQWHLERMAAGDTPRLFTKNDRPFDVPQEVRP